MKKLQISYDFNTIKNIFNNLNKDRNHFCNSNDICTPMECVKEMFDSVPEEFWQRKNIKILDSCCGNGNFHAYAVTKTSLSNLYFNEINEKRIKNLKNYFGEDINFTNKDFLEFEEYEQFDMVVSNPPYAKFNGEKRASKNHNLSRAFIEKAIKITKENGYILFIVPNNWMSFSDRNKLPEILSQYQFLHLDINGAKKWFPTVGSSFTWFLLKKTPNTNPVKIVNSYIIKDTQEAYIDRGVKFIPLYYNEMVRSIFNKTVNNNELPKYKIETSSDLHKYTKAKHLVDTRDGLHPYKIHHTPSQIVWSDVPHKYQIGFKLFLSLTNQYQLFIDNDAGMTQSIAFIRCENEEEAIRLRNELSNDVYKFINNVTRYGNFNNIRVLQNLPLWGSFELTEEENNFIREFNSKYYDKK